MYKGFIYGYRVISNGNISTPFGMNSITKDDSDVIDGNIVQNVIGGDLGPYREWEDKYNSQTTYQYRIVENKPFYARLKIGKWYTTASSAKIVVTWDDMQSYIYMDEFWKFLPRLIIDNSDPASVNIYIEGKFAFVSKGGAVGLQEVE